jgi:hypothetical protein
MRPPRTPNKSAYTDTTAGSAVKSPPGRNERPQSGSFGPRSIHPFYEFTAKFFETHLVGLAPGAHQKIDLHPCTPQPREYFTTPDLPEAALQTIPIHDPMPMLRHDDPKP